MCKLVESFVSKDAVAEIVESGTKEADSAKMGGRQFLGDSPSVRDHHLLLASKKRRGLKQISN